MSDQAHVPDELLSDYEYENDYDSTNLTGSIYNRTTPTSQKTSTTTMISKEHSSNKYDAYYALSIEFNKTNQSSKNNDPEFKSHNISATFDNSKLTLVIAVPCGVTISMTIPIAVIIILCKRCKKRHRISNNHNLLREQNEIYESGINNLISMLS